MTTVLLHDIIKLASPLTVTLSSTDKETRILAVKNVEMHISIGRNTMYNKLVGTVEMRTQDFLKLLRETKVFSDIEFSKEKKTATLHLGESGTLLSLECPLTLGEYQNPPVVPVKILCNLNPGLIREINAENASSVEFIFEKQSLRIGVRGEIRTEAVQKNAEYIKREEGQGMFVMSSESFQPLVHLCRLAPNRVIMGVERHLCTFYVYFKEVTVIVYSQGALM